MTRSAGFRRQVAIAIAIAALALLVLPLDAQALTWTGEGNKLSPTWSTSENWAGTAPLANEKLESLEFPALSATECRVSAPNHSCYTSKNNVKGIEAKALSIDDGVPYEMTGEGIKLGSGGITAKPSLNDCSFEEAGCHPPFIGTPITLSAPQTWSISGGAGFQQLAIFAPVEGEADSLKVNFPSPAFLDLFGEAEVGSFVAKGPGGIAVFGSLNGTDENPVEMSGGGLLEVPFETNTIGPFTGSETGVIVGAGSAPDATLAVHGSFALDSTSSLTLYVDHAGTQPGLDYSQLSARGPVNLGGAHLELGLGVESVGAKFPCAKLHAGDVDTLITTTGSLTGTFAGVPNGAEVPFSFCFGELGTEEGRKLRINYTEHSVTATVLESPAEKKAKAKAEAEAAAKRKAEAEAAAKRKAEEEAAAKRKAEEEATAKKKAEEIAATSVKIVKVRVTSHSVVVTITLSRGGTVTITGRGLKTRVVKLGAGTHKVTVALTRLGKAERRNHKKIKLSVRLVTNYTTVTRSERIRL